MHVLPCFGQKSGLAPDPLPATQIPGPEIKLLTQPLVQVAQHLCQEAGRWPKRSGKRCCVGLLPNHPHLCSFGQRESI